MVQASVQALCHILLGRHLLFHDDVVLVNPFLAKILPRMFLDVLRDGPEIDLARIGRNRRRQAICFFAGDSRRVWGAICDSTCVVESFKRQQVPTN